MENENGVIKNNLTYVDIFFFLIRVNLHLAPFASSFLITWEIAHVYLFIYCNEKRCDKSKI